MSDVFSKAKRSEVMSRIRSRGNKDTEVKLAGLLREHGITGWRRQTALKYEVRAERSETDSQRLPAGRSKAKSTMNDERGTGQVKAKKRTVRPDFVFRCERVAVFVDGCFWHGCTRHATRPNQNRAFWDAKLARNKARDRAVTLGLKRAGWTVLRIWECALSAKRSAATMGWLRRALGTVPD